MEPRRGLLEGCAAHHGLFWLLFYSLYTHSFTVCCRFPIFPDAGVLNDGPSSAKRVQEQKGAWNLFLVQALLALSIGGC